MKNGEEEEKFHPLAFVAIFVIIGIVVGEWAVWSFASLLVAILVTSGIALLVIVGFLWIGGVFGRVFSR